MPVLRAPVRLERRRLRDALTSPASFVALVGPTGSGATTLLRAYAERVGNVQWVGDGALPERVTGVLVVDRAEALTAEGWEHLRALRSTTPGLVVRAAAYSAQAIPRGWDAELVTGLAFTPEETAEYVTRRGSTLDPRTVHQLTGGLPAAVVAVVQANVIRPDVVRDVLARVAPEALPGMSAALAVPAFLTPEIVARLDGPEDLIDRAERAGRGAWRTDDGAVTFALTAPVRAAALAATPVGEAEARAIRTRAAEILLRDGAWLGAVTEGAAVGALEIVDAALKRGGLQLLGCIGAAIRDALRPINVLQLRRWPVIAMALALIFNARRQQTMRAIELMGVAMLGAQMKASGSAERALLSVVESVGGRLTGVGDGGVKAARAAARILDEMPRGDLEQIPALLADLRNHAGVSLLHGGHPARPRRSSSAPSRRRRGPATSSRPSAGSRSLLHMARAKLALERGAVDDAVDALARVWHIVDTIEHWPLLAVLRASCDLQAGRIEEGRERLRTLRAQRGGRLRGGSPFARGLELAEASLALAAGDLVAARRLTARASDAPEVLLGVARVALFDGQDDRALRLLSEVPESGPAVRAGRAVLQAIVLHRLGRGPTRPRPCAGPARSPAHSACAARSCCCRRRNMRSSPARSTTCPIRSTSTVMCHSSPHASASCCASWCIPRAPRRSPSGCTSRRTRSRASADRCTASWAPHPASRRSRRPWRCRLDGG